MPSKKILALALGLSALQAYADTIDIYAHRGFRPIMPENTLVAYQAAMKIGVNVVDMDINMTKDGVLVVTHDLTLNPDMTRNATGQWIEQPIAIKSLTFEQLQTYDVGALKPHSPIAAMYPYHQGIDGTRIPSLQQVFDYVLANDPTGKIRFQIEMKTDPTSQDSVSPEQMAEALNAILIKNNLTDRVEVQAFDWECLIALQKLNPKVKTAYLTDHTTEPMSANDDSMSLSGVWTAGLKPQDYDFNYPKMIHELGGTFWEPYELDLTKTSLDQAHQLGLKVVTWGWTEAEGVDFNYPVIEQLLQWHVDGIITDRPDILRGLEAGRGFEVPVSINAKAP